MPYRGYIGVCRLYIGFRASGFPRLGVPYWGSVEQEVKDYSVFGVCIGVPRFRETTSSGGGLGFKA